MASLYCSDHGEIVHQNARKERGKYDNEYTKVVIGLLSSPGYVCDTCNRPLAKSEKAYYVAHLSKRYSDTRGEAELFDMATVEVKRL